MAILAECPRCHKKQAERTGIAIAGRTWLKRNESKGALLGHDRLPNGKQRREHVGHPKDGRPAGIEEARAAEGKRRPKRWRIPPSWKRPPPKN